MNKTPFPFQEVGIDFLASNPHALLADAPGLGKTIQAIGAYEALNLKSALVVCPASVRMNWRQEIDECLDTSYRWDIISYNDAVSGKSPLADRYDLLIMDEEHFLKSPDSQRTQSIFGDQGLARRAHHKWALTGTPVLNRPVELYPILSTLAAHTLGKYTSYANFTQKFCGAYWDGRGINTKGATNIADLGDRLSRFMLRRTKEEVLHDLPPLVKSRIPLDLTKNELRPVHEVEATIQNREEFLSATHEALSQLGDMATLLRVTGEAKVPQSAAFIKDLLQTVPKVVVFAKHRSVIKRLFDTFHGMGFNPVVHQGGMTDSSKQMTINKFMDDDSCRVFIGNIQSAGTGIDGLQKVCSDVVFVELSWVPGEMAQAIDRVRRIGHRKVESINAYLLHAPGTLESAVLSSSDAKQKVIDLLMQDNILGDLV